MDRIGTNGNFDQSFLFNQSKDAYSIPEIAASNKIKEKDVRRMIKE